MTYAGPERQLAGAIAATVLFASLVPVAQRIRIRSVAQRFADRRSRRGRYPNLTDRIPNSAQEAPRLPGPRRANVAGRKQGGSGS